MIFGARVEQAREFRGLTQAELATLVGVNQTAIARVESGSLTLSDDKGSAIANALDFPPSFFEREIPEFFGMGTLEFRADASVTAKEKKRAHQYASIVFELAIYLAARLKMPPMRLPRLSGTPEEAASALRSELAVSPNAPIKNLTAVLERAGVFVFSLPDLHAGCHGFSVWGANDRTLIPAIYVDSEAVGDRARHTIAHEVGELTLVEMPAGRAREKFASQFAAALLMPPDAIKRDLVPPLDLTDFFEAKVRYGASAQSLIMRTRQLKIISQRRYEALLRELGAAGFRTAEPAEYDVPREKPRALHKMVELLYGVQVDLVRLGDDSRLNPWLLRRILTTHASAADLKPITGSSGKVILFRSERREASKDAIEA